MRKLWWLIAAIMVVVAVLAFLGRNELRGRFVGSGPWTYDTEDYRIRVARVVDGLSHPWSLAFLPSGDILVTERAGRLRLIRSSA